MLFQENLTGELLERYQKLARTRKHQRSFDN
jgi:hypothetical protein